MHDSHHDVYYDLEDNNAIEKHKIKYATIYSF